MEPNSTSEEALVEAAKGGNRQAFDLLAQKYRSAAVTLARQFLPSDAAEDAAQDALIASFRALGNLDDPSRFKAWLGAIVRNRACRMVRERKLKETLPIYEMERLVQLPTEPADDDIGKAVEKLPTGIREAVRLYYYESWSVGEIAAFTARPVTTVKWQLHAGRELLRRELSHLEEEEPCPAPN